MLKRIITTMVAAIVALAGGILVATPASAAELTCNSTTLYTGYLGGVIVMPARNGSISCKLSRGLINNPAVKQLQIALNHCWTPIGDPGINIAEDGDFGGNTFAALKAVQGAWGISSDGGYGPETRGTIQFPTPSFTDCWGVNDGNPGPYWF